MMNFKKLDTKQNIVEEAMKLGDFVGMYKNGILQEIIDMKYGIGLNNLTSIEEDDIWFATKSENAINIVLKSEDIIEVIKSNKSYRSKESIINGLLIHDIKERIEVDEYHIKGNVTYKEQYRSKLKDSIELVIDKIKNIYNKSKARELQFIVEENRILFKEEVYDNIWFNDEEHEMYCSVEDEQWYVLDIRFGEAVIENNKVEIAKDNKIVISNKFKQHMSVHQNDFKIHYHKLVKYMESKGCFNNLKNGFIEMVVELPFYIGYTSLVETDDTHQTFYAKRKNRDIYSRFTISGEKRLTNKCVIVLNQSYTNPNEYYLVTMFPGEHLVREVQDKNIKSEEERKKVLDFWSGHALILNFDYIELDTVARDCPYIEKV